MVKHLYFILNLSEIIANFYNVNRSQIRLDALLKQKKSTIQFRLLKL